ncbi:MAG: ComEC/Rec2 family competence protein, partial [Candidatus Zixiibacteriota bacterium]
MSTDQRIVPAPGARRPALWAAALIALGVLLADRADWMPAIWASALAGSALLVLLGRRSRAGAGSLLVSISIWLMLLTAGGLRMGVANSGRPDPDASNLAVSGQAAELHGRLASIPIERSTGWRATIDLESAKVGDSLIPLDTRALIATSRSLEGLTFGDYVVVPGRLRVPPTRRNPGGFDYATHLQRQGTDFLLHPTASAWRVIARGSPWSLHNLIEPLRDWIRRTAGAIFRPVPAAMIQGFLLGDTDGVPARILGSFRDSGTYHLLAVSGANVWLTLLLFIGPLRVLRVPRTARTVILIAVAVGFCFLTRNEPSVVRASLMAGAVLIGRILFRPVDTLNSIGLAALIILTVSPAELFRAGFQLSFAAVIGIVVVHARLSRGGLLPRNRLANWAVTLVASSAAATLATAPIVAAHFGVVPLLSLPANLIMVPLAALISYVGIAAFGLAALSVTLAAPAVAVAEFALAAARETVRVFGDMGAIMNWPDPSHSSIAAFYLVAGLALSWRQRYRWARPVAYLGLAASALLLVGGLQAKSPSPTVAFLDAGRNRLAAVIAPTGQITWIADDPGPTESDRQWLTGPFMRALEISDQHESVVPWRRADSTIVDWTSAVSGSPFWRCVTSPSDSPNEAPLSWADVFTWNSDTVIHVRDIPAPGHHVAEELIDRFVSTAKVLVFPSRAPLEKLRRMLDRAHSAQAVLFYGPAGWMRDEPSWLNLWKAHYPMIDFYFTGSNGGVILTWTEQGAELVPFIAPFAWRDADYR